MSDWNASRVRRTDADPAYTIAHSLCVAARELRLDALVVPTLSGRSARLVSAHRPTVPIYALSPGRETVRRCGLMWGVQAASMRRHETTEALIADAARRVVELGWCEPGQRVGITAGLPTGDRARRAWSRSSALTRRVRQPWAASADAIARATCSARRADARAPVELGLFAPELGDRLIAVDPLAGDPVPVGARAQLREHREREHLHAPAEQVLGRMSWWRISRKWRERGSELSIITWVAISGVSCTASSAVVYHQIASSMNASRCSGSTRSGSGRKPDSASSLCSVGASPSTDRALAGELELDRRRGPCA